MPPPGLRERQKAERRRAISDAATALFMERGFEAVTLAEVAEAANVSVKTIFNYFGSKEELFLDREEELRGAVLRALAERAPGATITAAVADLLSRHWIPDGVGDWSTLRDPEAYELFRRFLVTWHASPALRGRHLLADERLADALAEAVAAETAIPADDDRIRAMAAMLVAAMHLRHRTLAEAVLAEQPPEAVEARVRAVAAEAMARVATAFGDLDVERG